MFDSKLLNDHQIEKNTQVIREGQAYRFRYELPSGRTVSSDSGPLDQLKRAMITWCEFVRGQIEADTQRDMQDREAKLRQRLSQESPEERAIRMGENVPEDPRAPVKAPEQVSETKSPGGIILPPKAGPAQDPEAREVARTTKPKGLSLGRARQAVLTALNTQIEQLENQIYDLQDELESLYEARDELTESAGPSGE